MTFWRFVLQSYNTGCPVRPAPVVDLIDGWDAALTQTQHPSPFGDILQALGFGQPETLYDIPFFGCPPMFVVRCVLFFTFIAPQKMWQLSVDKHVDTHFFSLDL